MSGLLTVVGAPDPAAALAGMAARRPRRGPLVLIGSAGPLTAGIQGRDEEHPYLRGALRQRGDVLCALVGVTFSGHGVLEAGPSADLVLERWGAQDPFAGISGSYVAVAGSADGRTLAYRSFPGERSLFIRSNAGVIEIASEVGSFSGTTLDRFVLIDQIAGGWSVTSGPERSLLTGVDRVMPGEQVQVRREGLVRRRLHRAPEPVRTQASEAIDSFRSGLSIAVSRRLQRPVGILVSGGLDSTSIATVARPLHVSAHGTPPDLVSATYPEHPDVDESRYVTEFAARSGGRLTWVRPNLDMIGAVDVCNAIHGQPDLQPMSENFRLQLAAAREAGIQTLFDGHDGDAVFGSNTGAITELLRRRAPRVALRAAMHRRARRSIGTLKATLVFRSALIDLIPAARALRESRRPAPPVPGWVRGDLRDALARPAPPATWDQARDYIIERGIPRLLESAERLAEHEGVWLLHPMSDADFLGEMMSFGPEVHLRDGPPKSVARAALPELPASIRNRADKTSFGPLLSGAVRPEVLERSLTGTLDWYEPGEMVRAVQAARPAEVSLMLRVLAADRFVAGAS